MQPNRSRLPLPAGPPLLLSRLLRLLLLLATICLCSTSTFATVHLWIGDDDALWSNPNNWNTSSVPQTGDQVLDSPDSVRNQVLIDEDAKLLSLDLRYTELALSSSKLTVSQISLSKLHCEESAIFFSNAIVDEVTAVLNSCMFVGTGNARLFLSRFSGVVGGGNVIVEEAELDFHLPGTVNSTGHVLSEVQTPEELTFSMISCNVTFSGFPLVQPEWTLHLSQDSHLSFSNFSHLSGVLFPAWHQIKSLTLDSNSSAVLQPHAELRAAGLLVFASKVSWLGCSKGSFDIMALAGCSLFLDCVEDESTRGTDQHILSTQTLDCVGQCHVLASTSSRTWNPTFSVDSLSVTGGGDLELDIVSHVQLLNLQGSVSFRRNVTLQHGVISMLVDSVVRFVGFPERPRLTANLVGGDSLLSALELAHADLWSAVDLVVTRLSMLDASVTFTAHPRFLHASHSAEFLGDVFLGQYDVTGVAGTLQVRGPVSVNGSLHLADRWVALVEDDLTGKHMDLVLHKNSRMQVDGSVFLLSGPGWLLHTGSELLLGDTVSVLLHGNQSVGVACETGQSCSTLDLRETSFLVQHLDWDFDSWPSSQFPVSESPPGLLFRNFPRILMPHSIQIDSTEASVIFRDIGLMDDIEMRLQTVSRSKLVFMNSTLFPSNSSFSRWNCFSSDRVFLVSSNLFYQHPGTAFLFCPLSLWNSNVSVDPVPNMEGEFAGDFVGDFMREDEKNRPELKLSDVDVLGGAQSILSGRALAEAAGDPALQTGNVVLRRNAFLGPVDLLVEGHVRVKRLSEFGAEAIRLTLRNAFLEASPSFRNNAPISTLVQGSVLRSWGHQDIYLTGPITLAGNQKREDRIPLLGSKTLAPITHPMLDFAAEAQVQLRSVQLHCTPPCQSLSPGTEELPHLVGGSLVRTDNVTLGPGILVQVHSLFAAFPESFSNPQVPALVTEPGSKLLVWGVLGAVSCTAFVSGSVHLRSTSTLGFGLSDDSIGKFVGDPAGEPWIVDTSLYFQVPKEYNDTVINVTFVENVKFTPESSGFGAVYTCLEGVTIPPPEIYVNPEPNVTLAAKLFLQPTEEPCADFLDNRTTHIVSVAMDATRADVLIAFSRSMTVPQGLLGVASHELCVQVLAFEAILQLEASLACPFLPWDPAQGGGSCDPQRRTHVSQRVVCSWESATLFRISPPSTSTWIVPSWPLGAERELEFRPSAWMEFSHRYMTDWWSVPRPDGKWQVSVQPPRPRLDFEPLYFAQVSPSFALCTSQLQYTLYLNPGSTLNRPHLLWMEANLSLLHSNETLWSTSGPSLTRISVPVSPYTGNPASPARSYQLSGRITDAYGNSWLGTDYLIVHPEVRPDVHLKVKPEFLEISASDQLELEAFVDTDSCSSLGFPPETWLDGQFVWRYFDNSNHSHVIDTVNGTLDWVIAPGTLRVNHAYMFELLGHWPNRTEQLHSVASHLVIVKSKDLSVQVTGEGSREVFQSEMLILDGSRSRDPNFPLADPDSHFVFSWTCESVQSLDPCPELETLVPNNSRVLQVPPHSFPLGEFRVRLNFSSFADLEAEFPRWAVSRWISVTVLPEPEEPVTLPTPWVSAPQVINANQNLRVQGSLLRISEEEGGALQSFPINSSLWAVQWSAEVLQADLLWTPFPLSAEQLLTPSLFLPSITVRRDVLQSNRRYRFRLKLWHKEHLDLEPRLAGTEVQINGPPSGGLCSVVPSLGYALWTQFQVSCVGWHDEELPLSYSVLLEESEQLLVADSFQSSSSLLLGNPPVPGSSSWEATLVARVKDASGAAVEVAAGTVTVRRNPGLSDPDLGQMSEPPECVLHTGLAFQLPQAILEQKNSLGLQLVAALLDPFLEDVLLLSEHEDWRDAEALQAGCDQENEQGETQLHLPPLTAQELALSLRDFRAQVFEGLLLQLAQLAGQLSGSASGSSLGLDTAEQLAGLLLRAMDFPISELQPQVAERVLDALEAVVQSVGDNRPLAESVVVVLSRLLENVDCSQFDRLVGLVRVLSSALRQGSTPEEGVEDLLSENLRSGGARQYATQNLTVEVLADELRFSLSPALLQNIDGGLGELAFVDVTINRFSAAGRRCRPGSSGDVVEIDIGDGDTVEGGFTFDLPLDEDVGKHWVGRSYSAARELWLATGRAPGQSNCSRLLEFPVCGWWNETAASAEDQSTVSAQSHWVTEGCEPASDKPVHQLPSGSFAISCHCVHLTEFAALLRRLQRDGPCSQTLKTADHLVLTYQLGAGLYALLLLLVLVQLSRLAWATRVQQVAFLSLGPTLQHVLLLLVIAGRLVGALWFSEAFDLARVLAALVSSLPYLVMFWVFTLLIFQWHVLIHSTMRRASDAFARVRPLFLVLNLLACAVILALTVVIAEDPGSQRASDFTLIGSAVMAALTLATGLAFLWYGQRVARLVRQTQSSASLHSNAKSATASSSASAASGTAQGSRQSNVARKMSLTSLVVAGSFAVLSQLWLASVLVSRSESQAAAGGEEGEGQETSGAVTAMAALFVLADVFALSAVLYLYLGFVNKQFDEARSLKTDTFSKSFTETSQAAYSQRRKPTGTTEDVEMGQLDPDADDDFDSDSDDDELSSF